MGVNVLSQGRQINTGTTYNSLNTISISDNTVNDASFIVNKNERSSIDAKDFNAKQESIDEKDVKDAVDKVNKFLQGEATHVEYERHDTFKSQFVIKIVNNKTKEVIKEIPPKKILDMVAEMCKLAGVIIDEKA